MSVQSKGSVLARLFPGLFDAIAANVSQDEMNQMEEQAAVLEAKMAVPAPSGQAATPPAEPATPPVETPAPVQAAVETPKAVPGSLSSEDVVASFNAMKAMMESFMKAQTAPAPPAAPAAAPVQGSAVVPVAGDVSNGPTAGNAEGDNAWYNDLKRLKGQYTKFGLTDHISV